MKRRFPSKNRYIWWGAGVKHIHSHWHGDCACIEGQCSRIIATRMKLIANNDYKDCCFGGQGCGVSGNIDGAHSK